MLARISVPGFKALYNFQGGMSYPWMSSCLSWANWWNMVRRSWTACRGHRWYFERQAWMKPSPPSGNHYWSGGRGVSDSSHGKDCMRHVMTASKLSWQDRLLHSWINDYLHRKFNICSRKTNSKHDDRSLTSRMQMDKAGEMATKQTKEYYHCHHNAKAHSNAKHDADTLRPKLSPLGFLF